MSIWRGQFEDEELVDVALDWLGRYYHVFVLFGLFVFTLWNRARTWGNFVFDGEVFYRSNDPYYHLRSTQYVVENWPATMPFDPWTYFAQGTSNSQFGTLFDQLIGTAALVIGLGSPSEMLVRKVVLFAPPVFGALILIPAYFIGRRLGGRVGGLTAAAVVAFSAGELLSRSLVGFTDHQVAEALFAAVAVLGMLAALAVASREKPVYELVEAREWEALRRTAGWSLLAGVGVAAYLWVWPPGIMLVGILGAFFLLHLSVAYLRGNSPEHAAFVGVVSLGTAGILNLSTVHTLSIGPTSRSLLQPGLPFAVAVGCLFLAWLAREWDDRDLNRLAYPAAVGGLLLAMIVGTALLVPSLFDFFINNLLRVFGLGHGTNAAAGTVGEVAPQPVAALYEYYKFAIVTAAAGGVIALAKVFLDDDHSGEELLIVVWALLSILASLTQTRFAVYATVPVAALNAILVGWVVRSLRTATTDDGVELYQVMTIVTVFLVVVTPMLVVTPTAMGAADTNNPGRGIFGWDSGLDWLDDNAPEPGTYANPDGEPMEYFGTYARTDDYDYPEGAYGVMSWWDYGHWITAEGGAIPNANPFQQGAGDAARFLLSQNESQAADVLASIDEDDAKTRYVMVDWKMAETEANYLGKFFAPTQFDDSVELRDFYSRIINDQGRTALIRHKQPYYESMVARLYHYHGSAASPQPVVLDWQGEEIEYAGGRTYSRAPSAPNTTLYRTFPNMSAAREYVDADPTGSRQIGGVGGIPTERVPALEHYRLVHQSDVSALSRGTGYFASFSRMARSTGAQNPYRFLYTAPTWTKTFERVDGATIQGIGPANTNVTASVKLKPGNGSQFTYRQRVQTGPDGEFTMTVPYATTGYGEVGIEEGYTNTSVRALGPYQLTTPGETGDDLTTTRYAANVSVTESQVVGLDDSPVEVTLEEEVVEEPEGATNGTNGTSGAGGTDSGTDGADGNETTNDTQNAVAPTGFVAGESIGVSP
ncbi:oligosaccharyl transferase, archaeosortase A system-associated [Halobacteriales archaeon Cl-PHB]